MSGGVDSSVTAMLVSQRYPGSLGMFMKNWEEDDRFGNCPAEEDADDARRVADMLGFKLYTRNFATEYWDHVFEHFLDEYRRGRTPNPDILCNREIKFKTFLEHAEDLGGDYIATGHYARVDEVDGRWRLLRGRDRNKDQSYFLYTLGQAQLARTLFPIGELEKPAVRDLAREAQLPVAEKKDSTGVCFIGERDFKPFLQHYLGAQPGEIVDVNGKTVGEHDGLMFYTLGQRKGIGIGGMQGADEQPWYVVDKDIPANRLIIGQGHDHPRLQSQALDAMELSWTSGVAPSAGQPLTAKVRYRQQDQACQIASLEDGVARVLFDQPQRAVTPGQSIVFYDGEECLGGGIIERRLGKA
jgi:tRNA-specific 2-thiouridylase